LRRALLDIDEIGEFIAQDSPTAARQTIAQIVQQVGLLTGQPALGRPGRVPGTRELIIPTLPFIVPYRVRGGAIEILRVMHSARQWPKRFSVQEQQAAYGGAVARPASRKERARAGGVARGVVSKRAR
jgi:plasmid stabilization system protein ParE